MTLPGSTRSRYVMKAQTLTCACFSSDTTPASRGGTGEGGPAASKVAVFQERICVRAVLAAAVNLASCVRRLKLLTSRGKAAMQHSQSVQTFRKAQRIRLGARKPGCGEAGEPTRQRQCSYHGRHQGRDVLLHDGWVLRQQGNHCEQGHCSIRVWSTSSRSA